MENKGLCATCSSGKVCSFPRKFPVVFCEEFDIIARETGTRKRKSKSKK